MTKSIIKKVALILAGIAAISAVGFGIAKLVEFTRADLKTISPSFEVGNLGTDGKYVSDESTLYTKDAFKCDGLQIKLDFDNTISYQIYYYDDLDTFIEVTDVLTGAYSGGIHDSYARIVITPTDDEDDKISWTERIKYAGQMEVRVNKVQDIEYVEVLNRRLKIVNDKSVLRFSYGTVTLVNGSYEFFFNPSADSSTITSMDVLKVKSGSKISVDYTSAIGSGRFGVLEFKMNNGNMRLLKRSGTDKLKNIVLSEETEYIVLIFTICDSEEKLVSVPNIFLSQVSSYIVITK